MMYHKICLDGEIWLIISKLSLLPLIIWATANSSLWEYYPMRWEANISLSEEWPVDLILTHFILETPKGVLAKSADPDQMPHNVASDLGLHYFASCSTIFQQKYLN